MRFPAYLMLTAGAIGTAGYALIAFLQPGIQSPVYRELVSNVEWSGKLHIVAGALALVLGPFQLSQRIRTYSIELHKNVGRTYVVFVLLSTVGAVISLPTSTSGWAAKSAFWFLATAWPTVTIAGYPIRSTFSLTKHARFMIFSLALTCSAVSLRIYLGVLLALGMSFDVCYPISAWGGIITNLLIATIALVFFHRRRGAQTASSA